MRFPPGRIMNFGHNGFQFLIGLVVAIIKTDRIKTITEILQMGQHADRACGARTGLLSNYSTNRCVKRNFRIPKMMFAVKTGNIRLLI